MAEVSAEEVVAGEQNNEGDDVYEAADESMVSAVAGEEEQRGNEEEEEEDEGDDEGDIDVVINLATGTPGGAGGGGGAGIIGLAPSSGSRTWVRSGIAPIQKFSYAPQEHSNKPTTVLPDAKQSIYELDPETLEEKPWRKVGADVSDWFNYGFTEETWNAYRERENRMRAMNQMQSKIQVFDGDNQSAARASAAPPGRGGYYPGSFAGNNGDDWIRTRNLEEPLPQHMEHARFGQEHMIRSGMPGPFSNPRMYEHNANTPAHHDPQSSPRDRRESRDRDYDDRRDERRRSADRDRDRRDRSDRKYRDEDEERRERKRDREDSPHRRREDERKMRR